MARALALVLLACGCRTTEQEKGPRTPEAFAARATAAAETGAYGDLLALVEPASRTRFVADRLAAFIGRKSLDPDWTSLYAEQHAILARYGIMENFDRLVAADSHPEIIAVTEALEKEPEAMLAGVDQEALFTDVAHFLWPGGSGLPRGPATDVHIEDGHASCRIGQGECRLVLIDGVWYLAPFDDEQ